MKRPAPEPELRLLLEDYPAARGGSTQAESGTSFESPEPHFLPEDSGSRLDRWLVEHEGDPDAAPDETPLRLLIEDFQPAQRFRERHPTEQTVPELEPGPEPNFVVAWDADSSEKKRLLTSRSASIALHLALILVALFQPRTSRSPEPTEPDPGRQYTKITLTAPSPEQLAQMRPQARGDEGEAPTPSPAAAPNPVIAPEVKLQPTPAPPMQPLLQEPVPLPPELSAAVEIPTPVSAPEPAAARTPTPGEFQPGIRLAEDPQEPTTRAPEQERPRLQLENARAMMPAPDGPLQLGEMKLTRGRDEMAAAAISQMSDQGGGRQAVGDGVGAAAIGGYSAPSKGNIGSGLELLSDPEGVDFRPYLLQILNSVRRNWFAVIPESARLGLEKGRVALQFSISRQGDVPKLVISSSARSQPLDRASVAGVSASLPFPPLPADFKGDEIRVQFVFLYNVKP
ncbi:MAG: TonB family protein [Acidobacteria bacterium]|nr:TonB family protein [Acidobacteriota bacterium]MDA1233289.1 TonB family protein [Acidobacteriota bacterium]